LVNVSAHHAKECAQPASPNTAKLKAPTSPAQKVVAATRATMALRLTLASQDFKVAKATWSRLQLSASQVAVAQFIAAAVNAKRAMVALRWNRVIRSHRGLENERRAR
jgi:hypothetical protein